MAAKAFYERFHDQCERLATLESKVAGLLQLVQRKRQLEAQAASQVMPEESTIHPHIPLQSDSEFDDDDHYDHYDHEEEEEEEIENDQFLPDTTGVENTGQSSHENAVKNEDDIMQVTASANMPVYSSEMSRTRYIANDHLSSDYVHHTVTHHDMLHDIRQAQDIAAPRNVMANSFPPTQANQQARFDQAVSVAVNYYSDNGDGTNSTMIAPALSTLSLSQVELPLHSELDFDTCNDVNVDSMNDLGRVRQKPLFSDTNFGMMDESSFIPPDRTVLDTVRRKQTRTAMPRKDMSNRHFQEDSLALEHNGMCKERFLYTGRRQFGGDDMAMDHVESGMGDNYNHGTFTLGHELDDAMDMGAQRVFR